MASYYVTSKTCAIKGATERAYGSGALMSLDMSAGVSWVPGEPTILFTASLCLPPLPADSYYCASHDSLRHHAARHHPVRHQPLSHSFRAQDVLKKPLHQHKIQRRVGVSRCCSAIGRFRSGKALRPPSRRVAGFLPLLPLPLNAA